MPVSRTALPLFPMAPTPFLNSASWIWSAEGTHAAPEPGAASPAHYQVRRFRRTFAVETTENASLLVHVSADSRYVLYCNGVRVGVGPAKGDIHHQFYDSHDLAAYLRPGKNVLAALVLDMSRVAHRPAHLGAPCSVMTYAGGFVLDGRLETRRGSVDLGTGPAWKVAVDTACRFQNDGTRFEGYHGYFEHRVSREEPIGWTEPDFEDGGWAPATVLYAAERIEHRRDPASPYGLVARMIPALETGAPAPFCDVFRRDAGDTAAGWEELLRSAGTVTVPPQARVTVILDAGELTTAFPQIAISDGGGATIRLTYAEALRLPWDTPGARLLGHRQPLANLASHFADEGTGWTFDRRGEISGWSDVWEPAGRGTPAVPEVFEPIHWRAFRFVGLEIATGERPLALNAVTHRFTAYPYAIAAEFSCSDPALDRLWPVGLRTMRLCAHETFEDCPHYEQMQYAGDTMITSKLGMLVAGDYRLSRQALHHFDWSRLPDGLTQSRYPSRLLQVIPSWSLHWISAARDYLLCSGDAATIRELAPGFRAVLDWFRRHADADGLPAALPYWNITDWCAEWPRGVVPGAATGPTTIIASQYIVALDETGWMLRQLGDTETAATLEAEAARLRTRLHARMWSEDEGLYFDRPGGPEMSQYGNAWAIVAGVAGARERERMLARFPLDPKLAPGSFFCWHAVFRALDLAGRYDDMPRHLGPWHDSVAGGLSTFAEENSYWRSLCHAWSAHPLLEFLTRILGVEPTIPGFAAVRIAPRRCGLTHAAGRVCTPHGPIAVRWRIHGGRWELDIAAPPGLAVTAVGPDRVEHRFDGGSWRQELDLA
ncbi:MAG TPA: alpha-L-rhamnosidase C-terminal domain-containing protein [Opitutaceae bacterium]|nr:alpha-L-rhamnosidase C-terminal domain-containing protein [Opitutaceae bacterium]